MALAKAMSRNDPDLVKKYRGVLVEGYGTSYEEAREHERRKAWEHYRQHMDFAKIRSKFEKRRSKL